MGIEPQPFGELLRYFRNERELSQLELGARAGASPRHISFMETGRANPSAAMIVRLGSALGLSGRATDDLRDSAGFSRQLPRPARRLGDRVFASVERIERSTTLSQVIEVGRSVLPELGITHFFLGTLYDGSAPSFDWADLGAFPADWLRSYDRERYAATDPLLAVVRRGRESFFWDDVIDRRALTRPARAMFDGVAAHGITSGFVTARRQGQSTRILSMMGPGLDHRDGVMRLGLEIVGSRVLAGIERLEAASP